VSESHQWHRVDCLVCWLLSQLVFRLLFRPSFRLFLNMEFYRGVGVCGHCDTYCSPPGCLSSCCLLAGCPRLHCHQMLWTPGAPGTCLGGSGVLH
jgi:hypothetical protein